MKICFIGQCGHVKNAYMTLKKRADSLFCGFAPGSCHETASPSFASDIPLYADYRDMLDQVSPHLAVVSPVFGLTGDVIVECANRGIHVFSEKPIATTEEQLSRVESAVRQSGIQLCAMHYLRFAPAFYHAAEMVRGGAIGEVKLLTAQKSYKFGNRPDWYSNRELFGGTIPWVGIHAIDWIYRFSGKHFLSVDAESIGSPEMAALCRFSMEDGVMASINLDYYRPASAPSHGDDRIRCVGTEGILEVRDKTIFLIDAEGAKTLDPPTAPNLLDEFLDGKCPIPAEEIFYLTRVSLAARRAADSGITVDIPLPQA